jgi:hypothetical protein
MVNNEVLQLGMWNLVKLNKKGTYEFCKVYFTVIHAWSFVEFTFHLCEVAFLENSDYAWNVLKSLREWTVLNYYSEKLIMNWISWRQLYFADEIIFHYHGQVNHNSSRIWALKNCHVMVETVWHFHSEYMVHVNAWSHHWTFFSEKINTIHILLGMLQIYVGPQVDNWTWNWCAI